MTKARMGRLHHEIFALIVTLGVVCGCGSNHLKSPGAPTTRPSQQAVEKSQPNLPATETSQQQALRALSAAMPDVQWDADSALTADFDFDNVADEAFLGHSSGKVWVGVVRATAQEPQILQFGIDPSVQNAICHEPAKLDIESLDYDDGSEIDGFQPSQQSKGLVLSDGDCDPIHLFWSSKTMHLGWWRN